MPENLAFGNLVKRNGTISNPVHVQGGQVRGDVGAVRHRDGLLLALSHLGVHRAGTKRIDDDSLFWMAFIQLLLKNFCVAIYGHFRDGISAIWPSFFAPGTFLNALNIRLQKIVQVHEGEFGICETFQQFGGIWIQFVEHI